MTIALKIKINRKRLKMTQTELGEKLGIKKNAVSKWERGRVEDIPLSKIKKLSQIFGVSVAYLVDDEQCSDQDAEILSSIDFESDEFYWHDLFKKHISKILADATVLDRTSDKLNMPDAWISINGVEIPVEIKTGIFNNAAMKQLLRYMNAYKSSRAIAVGKRATSKIPENVIFIPTSILAHYETEQEDIAKDHQH